MGRPHPVRGRRSTVFKSASSTAAELLAPPPSWPRFRVGAVITGPAQPSQGPGTDGLHPERTRRSATCRVPREMNREECVCCSFVFGGDFARPRAQLLGMAVVRAAPTREPYAHAERRRIRVWRKYWPDLPFHVSQASCTRKRTGYVIFTAVTTGPPLPPAICGLRCSLQLWWQGRRMAFAMFDNLRVRKRADSYGIGHRRKGAGFAASCSEHHVLRTDSPTLE